ncbi:hypothetical protein [Frankia sp. EI5c]|uniref:hypothetical protein n=1 Tax=Frankia sp. EI5c TaxID=683316 RepID=UPI001F5B7B0C|nr:hypothetical protein [Frankia sp. EI5c]
MPLLLAHLMLIFGSLAVLVLAALRLWKQVRLTRSAAVELKDRAAELGIRVTELAERLDSTQVTERLASRAG